MTVAPPGTVLVTGARGFIGLHLTEALRAAGARFIGTTRDAEAASRDENLFATDFSRREFIRPLLERVRSVVHLAGLTQPYGSMAPRTAEAFRAANVEATADLVRWSAEAGVDCFVHLSSVSAVAAQSDGVISESTLPEPTSLYGASKLEAEDAVRQMAGASLRAVSLRPVMVYGPGMKGNALRLFDLAWRRAPIPVGAIHNRRSVIFIRNLVAAISTALGEDAARGVFLLADEPALSTAELAAAISAALGRRSNVVAIPISVLTAAGRLGDLLSRVVPWPLTTREVSRITSSLAVDSSAFSSRTGYRQPYTLTEGLSITASWYRERAG
jgi:nucleoside-diphosphate-sugar epimerase